MPVEDGEQLGVAVEPEFKIDDEVFVCKGEGDVSSLDVLTYVADMTGKDGLKRIQAVVNIFQVFIPDDDGKVPEDSIGRFEPSSRQRFESLIKRRRVRLSLLFEIASGVLDDYLAFPTRAAESPSSNGSSPAVLSSVAVSSEPGSE
jgi:hypothetical protein